MSTAYGARRGGCVDKYETYALFYISYSTYAQHTTLVPGLNGNTNAHACVPYHHTRAEREIHTVTIYNPLGSRSKKKTIISEDRRRQKGFTGPLPPPSGLLGDLNGY